jgi:hypothetical protein
MLTALGLIATAATLVVLSRADRPPGGNPATKTVSQTLFTSWTITVNVLAC